MGVVISLGLSLLRPSTRPASVARPRSPLPSSFRSPQGVNPVESSRPNATRVEGIGKSLVIYRLVLLRTNEVRRGRSFVRSQSLYPSKSCITLLARRWRSRRSQPGSPRSRTGGGDARGPSQPGRRRALLPHSRGRPRDARPATGQAGRPRVVGGAVSS